MKKLLFLRESLSMQPYIKKQLTFSVVCVGGCLLVGYLSSVATEAGMGSWYGQLNKPGFTPPNWIFGPVWGLLYICMGISVALVWAKGFHHIWVKTAMYHFIFQLLFNALWSLTFFGLHALFASLLVIITLLILIGFTIKWFRVVDKRAALLLVPYMAWVAFATFLNFRIWMLN
jgi:tryptophan-rich sensory protein